MQRTFSIQLIKPLRARLVIDQSLDLSPLVLDEPCDWFAIADAEWLGICKGAWWDDKGKRCLEAYYERSNRTCMRTKDHIGPHVSGISYLTESPAIWY